MQHTKYVFRILCTQQQQSIPNSAPIGAPKNTIRNKTISGILDSFLPFAAKPLSIQNVNVVETFDTMRYIPKINLTSADP